MTLKSPVSKITSYSLGLKNTMFMAFFICFCDYVYKREGIFWFLLTFAADKDS